MSTAPPLPANFSALRQRYPQLGQASLRGSFFQSLAWFENLHAHGLEAVPSLSRLRLFSDAGGCLPLLDDGESLQALSNYYSSLYGPIGALPANLAASLRWQRRARVDLHPLDAQAAEFGALKQALTEAGYWVDDYYCFGNWYLDVGKLSFADYLASRPSQLRSNLQRGKGKLNKAGQWEITIQQQLDAQLEAAIAAFVQVYTHSWKQAEPQTEFIPGLCRTAAREGWLRLGVLRLDGQAVAAQLWFVHAGVASIYKLAYDEAASRYSAGTVLTAAMFAHVIDVDRVAEIDYLTGDEPYKQDWMSHRRERRGIIAFDLSQWQGLKAGMRHWLGRLLRHMRRAPNPTP